jgi:hypothetical protein
MVQRPDDNGSNYTPPGALIPGGQGYQYSPVQPTSTYSSVPSPQQQSTNQLNSYYNLYNAGVIQPNNALVDQQVHSLNSQLGLISAGNQSQQQQLQNNAGASLQGNNISRDDLSIQQRALDRQFALQGPEEQIQQGVYGVQQGDIAEAQHQYQRGKEISAGQFQNERQQVAYNRDRSMRAAMSSATARGAMQTKGYETDVSNIIDDMNMALGNISLDEQRVAMQQEGQLHQINDQQQLLEFTRQQHTLDYNERQQQLLDANDYLHNQGQRLNLSDNQIKANLQSSLDQLGLSNALSVEQVAAQIAAVEQGKFSPIGGLLSTIQSMAGLTTGSGSGDGQGTPQAVSNSGDISHPYGGTQYDSGHYPVAVDPFADFIIQHESNGDTGVQNNWDSNAKNGDPSLGIGQLTLSNRQHYGAQLGIDPNTTDFAQQYAMMTAYVNDRYGGWDGAKKYWDQHQNY